jgi:hypothetical protein
MEKEFASFSQPNSFFRDKISPLLPIIDSNLHMFTPIIFLILLIKKIIKLINIFKKKSIPKSFVHKLLKIFLIYFLNKFPGRYFFNIL